MSRILFILLLAFALFFQPQQDLSATELEVKTSAVETVMCPVTIDPGMSKFRCVNGNQMTLRLPYMGVAPGVTVTLTGPGTAFVGGDDPAVVSDGIIELIDLAPTSSYSVSIVGTSCFGPDAILYNFVTPAYTCGSDLTALINEVLPEPGSDANDDGVVNYLEEQFVEIFNPDPLVEIDMDGWVLIIGGVLRYTFPPASILGPRQALTVFGGGALSDPCYYAPAGFLSISANGDIVSLGDPTFGIIHTMSFSGTSFPPNVSLALNPDGNVLGGFVPHTTIVSNPVNYSPCFSNHMPGVVLPITLTNFTAVHRKGKVLLNWSTSREEGHAYFDVERSSDGRTWQSLKTVRTPINDTEETSEALHYELEDITPPTGLVFYRLRQVDQDGTATIYGPKRVTVPDLQETISLYPNPAHNQLWVGAAAQTGDFEIIDARGKRWAEGTFSGVQNAPVDITTLPAGMYFLRMLDGADAASVVRWVKR
ncbi:MAG: lamin tail domain-containing protein [Lewinella sp.]